MQDQEQISLTGKKGFKVNPNAEGYKTWADRLAEMDQLRRQLYTDMFGLPAKSEKTGEADTSHQNN
ncbi:MAG: hypothetical protein JNL72_03685 [Flavipsychrobacter sp.]|nr:hypothetical protein [Flavipsychrobacter sp.]